MFHSLDLSQMLLVIFILIGAQQIVKDLSRIRFPRDKNQQKMTKTGTLLQFTLKVELQMVNTSLNSNEELSSQSCLYFPRFINITVTSSLAVQVLLTVCLITLLVDQLLSVQSQELSYQSSDQTSSSLRHINLQMKKDGRPTLEL